MQIPTATNLKMNKFQKYINTSTEAAPLAAFRIVFGFMMLISLIRFWINGWIDTLYIQPKFFFSYYGFEWVKPLGSLTYLLFFICALSCLFIVLGYKFRAAIIVFFLSFTYIELMDKTTYLNHYYFISLAAFLLIFLPANAYFSIDAKSNSKIAFQKIPSWSIDGIKLLLAIVYFYAGLAKINSDWLIDAMPLKLWLAPKYDMPVIGAIISKQWVQYAFSWIGVVYDLSIPFLLLYKRTRLLAFVMVVVFHVLTWLLFPIGMFPFIMIFSTLIFFSPQWHHRALQKISSIFKINKTYFDNGMAMQSSANALSKLKAAILVVFFVIQVVFPFRYLLYPGELFWTEEGYRFSWRVMLMEKAGYAQFIVKDAKTGHSFYIENDQFLTPYQEKQMAFQPDFILEYAHFLHDHYAKEGVTDPIVTVESNVTLNGRHGTQFIDPTINLAKVNESFLPKTWITPFNDEIKGF